MKHILRRPLISEKNTYHNANNTFVFEVDLAATKAEIKNAVQKQFKVKVASVNTAQCRGRGKTNKFGMGKTPHWKKAMVKLLPGEKIALFEGV